MSARRRMMAHPGRVGWGKAAVKKGMEVDGLMLRRGSVAVLFRDLRLAELVRIRGAVRGAHAEGTPYPTPSRLPHCMYLDQHLPPPVIPRLPTC